MRAARVLVVHRDRILAEALARRLEREPGLRPVGTASTGPAAQSAVEALGPDVVVLDMALDDGFSLELAARLARRTPPVRVAAILRNDDSVAAARAIRAGANALTTTGNSATDLASAVTAVAADNCWVPPDLLGGVLREVRSSVPPPNHFDRKLARLTTREHDILDRMVAGHDRVTIARELGVTVNTVRTHAQNLLAKLGVHSALEAVSVARRARSNGSHV